MIELQPYFWDKGKMGIMSFYSSLEKERESVSFYLLWLRSENEGRRKKEEDEEER